MPLDKYTTYTFYQRLYAPVGMLQTITLRKRGLGQNQSTGTNYTLYGCRQKKIYYKGQNVAGSMTTDDYCVWQIPREELDRVGITDLNVIDTITAENGQVWQWESDGEGIIQLMKNMLNFTTKRIS